MTVAEKAKSNHVVIDGSLAGGGDLVCLNCGTRQKLPYPIDVSMMIVILEGFSKLHRKCRARPNPEAERNARCSDLSSQTPDEWIRGPDTGTSSATIWRALSGRVVPLGHWTQDGGVPHDPADFGRCWRLLKRIAGWRERLPEVAVKFPEWAPFVEAWPEMEALWEEEYQTGECPKLLALMRNIFVSDI